MNTLRHLGRYFILMGNSLFTRPEKFSMYWKEILRQMNQIGVGSLVIVAVISIFIGAVTAIQFSYQLGGQLIPTYYIGYIVRDMMIIELAPTFACMILAGKVGSNIASELGSMRITEQIDALEIMGVNTASYLIGPKVIAAVFIIPFLVIVSATLGILGGLLASMISDIPKEVYFRGLRYYFVPFNVVMMLIKGVVFAFILTSVSCYQGYNVTGGALGIGAASTRAVVTSSILILIADYIIASILL